MTDHSGFRKESDSLGSLLIPDDVYYGVQTQRAVENFRISPLRFPPAFLFTLATLKKCAAIVNAKLKILDSVKADAIIKAADEVIAGQLDHQFVVDLFQTGSGTSTNMNMNEVLATRANEILTGQKSAKQPVHPNDHVNLGQSSNDIIPTAIHITAARLIKTGLQPALQRLWQCLLDKAEEFREIKKVGRTHLQDAVPMTLGQEFSGYARQVELGMQRLADSEQRLWELAIGGTAVGTGLNAHPQFAAEVIKLLHQEIGIGFREATNHFAAQASQDTAVEMSGMLKTLAISLMKIANDIRLLSSGPKCGLGEITLPALQPGSSIMPGKVNPVIPEVVIQVAAQVIGNDTTISLGGQWGVLELNVMLPVIAYNLIQSIDLLTAAADTFAEKCIRRIEANREKCESYIHQSSALATYLIPYIGYDKAVLIAKKSLQTGKSVPEIVAEEKIVPQAVQDSLF
jgi:fumarate hydratase class II